MPEILLTKRKPFQYLTFLSPLTRRYINRPGLQLRCFNWYLAVIKSLFVGFRNQNKGHKSFMCSPATNEIQYASSQTQPFVKSAMQYIWTAYLNILLVYLYILCIWLRFPMVDWHVYIRGRCGKWRHLLLLRFAIVVMRKRHLLIKRGRQSKGCKLQTEGN